MDGQDEGEESKLPSRRVADELRSAIEAGDYPVGAALPTVRQLAAQHGVAVNTAMAAVRLLADEGYVTNKPTVGTFVRERTPPEEEARRLRAELGDLRARIRQVGEDLAAIEGRVAGLSDVAARLVDWTSRGEP